jgi:hypothetical protein
MEFIVTLLFVHADRKSIDSVVFCVLTTEVGVPEE